MKDPAVQEKGVNWARKIAKQQLNREAEGFYSIRDRFFFIDEHPENEQRFGLIFEEVVEEITA